MLADPVPGPDLGLVRAEPVLAGLERSSSGHLRWAMVMNYVMVAGLPSRFQHSLRISRNCRGAGGAKRLVADSEALGPGAARARLGHGVCGDLIHADHGGRPRWRPGSRRG